MKKNSLGGKMKKNKTLRDIELYHKINTDVKDDYDVLYNELREVAKEWIKYLENEFIAERPKELADAYKNKAAYQIQWIMQFFNLDDNC